MSTNGLVITPRASLSSRIRATLRLIWSSLIRPDRTASSTALNCRSGAGGSSTWSAPAAIERTTASASPYFCRTPAISSASVTMTPLKPIFSRSTPVRIGLLSVAGSPAGSSALTTMCAVMIESMPPLIAAWNGGASIAHHCSAVWLTSGIEKWLSSLVSPWPGKCFAVAITLPSVSRPLAIDAVRSAASFGSDENDRTPITGLSGLTLTSATGE